jgi:hypothetical protein
MLISLDNNAVVSGSPIASMFAGATDMQLHRRTLPSAGY